MLDVISIGDCTVDNFFKVDLKSSANQLCLESGSKFPAQLYQQSVAGNNANIAVGIAKLGLKVGLCSNIGDDLGGHFILKKLTEQGVVTRYIKVNAGVTSNASAVIGYQDDRVIFSYHQDWSYALPDLEPTKWIVLSSMGPSFADSSINEQIVSYLERTGARLVFAPGTHQIAFGLKKMAGLLLLTELLIVNVEEAKEIVSWKESRRPDYRKLLAQLGELGPKMVIITLGKEGSVAYDGVNFWQIGAIPAKLFDKTGAGDAFTAGVVSALVKGQDLTIALRWGVADAAAQVEVLGATDGLLTDEKMQDKLKENQKVKARKL